MKKFALFSVGVLFFLSCAKTDNLLQGSGNVISDSRQISTFRRLEVDGPINVFISQDDEPTLTVETDENLAKFITTEMDGNLLRIGYKNPSGYSGIKSTKGLNVYVNTNQLSELKNYGSGAVSSDDSWEIDSMEIENNGSGSIKFKLSANILNVENKGSGEITIAGNVDQQNISINGSGAYEALLLKSNSASVVIMGSGNVAINVEEELNAHIMGSGNLRYRGDPRLTTQVIGSGVIEKL